MKKQPTIDDFLARHARPYNGPRGVEYYSPSGLSSRLGVDADDLIQLAEEGALEPVGHRRQSVVGEVFGFRSDALNALRLGILVSFLEALAKALEPGDDEESEARFVDAATMLLRQARQQSAADAHTSRQESEGAVKKFSAALAVGRGRKLHAFAVGESLAVRRIGQRLAGLEPAGSHEFDEVLTGKIARDRYVKKIKDEDQDRRDANVARAGLAGAAAGALINAGPLGKVRPLIRAGIGAGVGVTGVLGVRAVTNGGKDLYGERSREAKRAEGLPALALTGAAGLAAVSRLRKLLAARKGRFGMSAGDRVFVKQLAPRGEAEIEFVAGRILGLLGKYLTGSGAVRAAQVGRRIGAKVLPIAGIGAAVGAGTAATDGDPETGVIGGALGGGLGAGLATAGAAGALGAVGKLGALMRLRRRQAGGFTGGLRPMRQADARVIV